MRIVVTGATGFLGGALARHFAAQGHSVVGSGRDRAKGAQLSAHGVRFASCALENAAEARASIADCDWVVHCAGLSSPWGPYRAFHAANVVATRNVVDACLAAGVARLIHISTPSLYMSGSSRTAVREDAPLPPPVNHYAATKKLAEDAIAAGARAGLFTISLRPRAIFGPGDTTIFPRLLRTLEHGRLPVIGPGDNRVDLTYIDNVVHAVERACLAGEDCRGRKYNITNGEPVDLWRLIRQLASALSLPAPRGRMPYALAMPLARGLELAHRAFGLGEPRITAYTVQVLALTMTLDISAARAELAYQPSVGVEEGLRRFVRWWQEAR